MFMISIKQTLNSSVWNLFKVSDESDKNLYREFISEQCRLITLISKKKNTLKNVLALLECKVQVKPCMATMGLQWIMNYFWLGCLTCSKIFSPNSAIKQNISLSENKWEAWAERNVLSLCFTLWPRHQPEAGHRKNISRQRQGKSAKKMTKCWRKQITELF